MLWTPCFPPGYKSNKAKNFSANHVSNVIDGVDLNAAPFSNFPFKQEQYCQLLMLLQSQSRPETLHSANQASSSNSNTQPLQFHQFMTGWWILSMLCLFRTLMRQHNKSWDCNRPCNVWLYFAFWYVSPMPDTSPLYNDTLCHAWLPLWGMLVFHEHIFGLALSSVMFCRITLCFGWWEMQWVEYVPSIT